MWNLAPFSEIYFPKPAEQPRLVTFSVNRTVGSAGLGKMACLMRMNGHKKVAPLQPPPQALRFSHGRGERETSDWWWTARDHGKGTVFHQKRDVWVRGRPGYLTRKRPKQFITVTKQRISQKVILFRLQFRKNSKYPLFRFAVWLPNTLRWNPPGHWVILICSGQKSYTRII